MGRKILIVDDDHDLLELTCLVLEKDGHSVSILADSTKIIEEVKNTAPDVILMDLWMPEVEGDEAVKLLRQDEATANIPVILFSAYPKLDKIASELEVAFMAKPFHLQELREKVVSV